MKKIQNTQVIITDTRYKVEENQSSVNFSQTNKQSIEKSWKIMNNIVYFSSPECLKD